MFDSERLQGSAEGRARLFTSTTWDRIGTWAPLIVVLVIAVLLRALKLDVFYSRDELTIWSWSDEFFSSLWRGDLAHSVLDSDYPGVTIYWLQSLYNFVRYGFLWLTSGHAPSLGALIEVPRSLAYLAERRLVMGLATSVQVWGIYALAAKAYNRRVALLGAFLVAVDPFLLAESRLLRAESLATGFMILSMLAWLVYLRRDQGRYLALSGLLAGWAMLTKMSSIFLVPIVGLLLLVDGIRRRDNPWQTRLKQNIKRGLAWSGLVVLSFWLSWPTLWVNPIPPLEAILVRGISQASQVSTWNGNVFFAGRTVLDDPGLLFYPVVIAFRSTPLMWLGAGLLIFIGLPSRKLQAFGKVGNEGQDGQAAGSSGAVSGVSRILGALHLGKSATHLRPPKTLDRPAISPWPVGNVGGLLVYIGVTFVLLSLTLSKVDRYLLPILPALDLLTALGLVWLYDWLIDKGGDWRRIATGGVLLVCAGQLGLTLSAYPYFYSYWNPLLGGGEAAVKMLPVGSGEGLDKAMDVMNRLPDAENLTLICGASRGWCEGTFPGTTWSYETLSSGDWMQADYVLLYIAWSQRQMYPQEVVDYLSRQAPVYQAELGGATYAWLYKVPEVRYTSGTKLEGRGTLYGYNLSATQLEAGQVLTATLYWRNEGQQPTDAFFVKVVDAAGYVWATALAQPRPGFEEANRTREAVLESEASLSLPIGMPPGHYFLKMGFVADNGQALVGSFELPGDGDDVWVALPSGSFPSADQVPIPHRLGSRLGPFGISTQDVSLLGYSVAQTAVRPGETVWLTLFWQARQDAPRDYAVGIRLLAADGREVTYWLGRPFYSGYPTPQWSRGQVVQDPWQLKLPEDVPPGDYELEFGLYDASSSTQVARTGLESIRVLDRQADADLPRMQYVAKRTFGDVATLLGYDVAGDLLPDGVRVRLTIHWQALRPTDRPYTVSVRLVDGKGLVLAEQESAPAAGQVSTTRWRPGEMVADLHEIEAAGPVPASGNLEVRLLDAQGNSIPTQDGMAALVISELKQKARWQVLPE